MNYHHLFYFWRVAHAGGLSAAAEQLAVSHSSLSVQIKELEGQLGGALFHRRGRGLVLTAFGREVLGYADEIFRLGRALGEFAEGRGAREAGELRVGVAPGVSSFVAARLLAPAGGVRSSAALTVRHGSTQVLLDQLVTGRLHAVLTDAPVTRVAEGRLASHALGSAPVSWYARAATARRHAKTYPRSLDRAPVLLPAAGTELRSAVDRWAERAGVRPRIAAVVDDAAMMRALAASGVGLMPARDDGLDPAGSLVRVGALEGVTEGCWAVVVEQRSHVGALDRWLAGVTGAHRALEPAAPPRPTRGRPPRQ